MSSMSIPASSNALAMSLDSSRPRPPFISLEESLAISREIGDRSGEAISCWNLAREWERRGEIGKAVDFAQITVAIEKETNHPDYEKSKAHLEELKMKLKEEVGPDAI